MKLKAFYTTLSLITLGTVVLLEIIKALAGLQQFTSFFYATLFFFVVFSVILFYVSKRAALHKNKMLFIYVMLFGTVVKFGFALMALFVYNKVYNPENKLFVLPFLGIYVIYTIFETYFMTRLGRLKKTDENE